MSAPSQSAMAVAGVQVPSRQQSSFVPFFHGRLPLPLTQLSTDCANAPDMEVAMAAVAKSDATLFSFFMILLSREGAVMFCKTSEPESESTGKPPALKHLHRAPTTDRLLCHRAFTEPAFGLAAGAPPR